MDKGLRHHRTRNPITIYFFAATVVAVVVVVAVVAVVAAVVGLNEDLICLAFQPQVTSSNLHLPSSASNRLSPLAPGSKFELVECQESESNN